MAEPGTPRTGIVTIGVAVLVVGAIATLGLWLAADERYDEGVVGLARAPVGCEAVLDFDDTGEFLVFVETTGRVADVRGDCDVAGAYDLEARPEVVVTVLDPDGRPLELVPVTGVAYDRAGFQGDSVATVRIAEAADHVIRVESDTGGFAVAIGRDPEAGVGLLRVVAVAAGVLAGAAGLAIVALGLRGRRPVEERATGRAAPMAPTPGESWYVTGPPTSPPRRSPTAAESRSDPPADPPRPAGPPTRIPGEPLAPGRGVGGRGDTGGDEPPTGPRLAPPGPAGPRRAPLPPPGRRDRPPGDEGDDGPRSPWAPPET